MSTDLASPYPAPHEIAAIPQLNMRARLIVEGLVAGLHKSPYHGFSAEFLEFRPCLPGENAVKIDWRAFARTDRYVSRVFEDETNCPVWLLVDTSASMGLRAGQSPDKLRYATTLAAALAWMFTGQRDAVGLCLFNSVVHLRLPPRSTQPALRALLVALARAGASGQTHCADALHTFAHPLHRRGMTILISDLLDTPPRLLSGLKHIRWKRQDTIVLRILDPLETSFDPSHPYHYLDSETGRRVGLDSRTAREQYRRGFEQHKNAISKGCIELGIDLHTVTTDTPFHKAILDVITRRRRLW